MLQAGSPRQVILAIATAAALSLPLLAFGQTAAPVPQASAPPDSPVPGQSNPGTAGDAPTGITPQGIMGTTPVQPPMVAPRQADTVAAPTTEPVRPVAADGLRTGRRISRMIGASVTGAGDQGLGKIDDVILPQGGGAPVAVLSVGGFLGVGARLVAVPLDSLLRAVNSADWMLPDATRESLAALPDFNADG